MVRRRIDIKPIGDNSKRHTTFTKRRQGLMKKTEEFCRKTDSEAAIIAFSKAGNGYVFGHPKADEVLSRYDAVSSSTLATEPENGGDGREEAAAAAPMEVENRIGEAVANGRWDEAVRDLELQELDELYAEVEKIKRKVAAYEREIAAAEKNDPPAAGSSGGDSSRACSS